MISFVDVLVIRRGVTLNKVYRNPTHTSLYLSFEYLYESHVKRVVHNLHSDV
jgi:hypothetical protein